MVKSVVIGLMLWLLLPGWVMAQEQVKEADFSFAVLGDTRPVAPADFVVSPALKRMVKEINLLKPEMVFHTGDMVFGYGKPQEMMQAEYRQAFNFYSILNAKVYYIPGNHDYSSSPAAAEEFLRLSGQKKYFSFDYQGAHFIILNTELPGEVAYIRGEQLE